MYEIKHGILVENEFWRKKIAQFAMTIGNHEQLLGSSLPSIQSAFGTVLSFSCLAPGVLLSAHGGLEENCYARG